VEGANEFDRSCASRAAAVEVLVIDAIETPAPD